MSKTRGITSISINGRITLNMHSLNNEGSEGNQVLTRQVTIIDQHGKPETVTAVSGDMMKHIATEHFWRIAKENNIVLSETSKSFNANRIIWSDLTRGDIKDIDSKNQGSIMDALIKTCALSDIAGAMITSKGNFARKSVMEFGWMLALPEANETDNYFHVKLVPDAKATKKESDPDDESGKSNEGQNIFHRPANSGIYAFVGNLEISRLGYNDVFKTYPISDEARKERYQALLKSVLYTFIKPNGAMRNTQNPHILNIEGAISYSFSSCPAPTVSGLKDGYVEEIEEITKMLNKIDEGNIKIKTFNSFSEFTDIFSELINKEPGKIKVAESTNKE